MRDPDDISEALAEFWESVREALWSRTTALLVVGLALASSLVSAIAGW